MNENKEIKDKIPKRYFRVKNQYPDVFSAYDELNNAVQNAGPLDEKTKALIKLAFSTGARLEGGIASHSRKAAKAGANSEELRQVAVMSLPTIGFPSMMAALKVVEEVIENK